MNTQSFYTPTACAGCGRSDVSYSPYELSTAQESLTSWLCVWCTLKLAVKGIKSFPAVQYLIIN